MLINSGTPRPDPKHLKPMHAYIRDELVSLSIRQTDTEGLAPEDSGLTAVAFHTPDNPRPSFRALLPPETLATLERAFLEPVRLGVLAEEPETPDAEIHAMVGLELPADSIETGADREEESSAEPWSTSSDAWRGDVHDGEDTPRTVLLAFAPLVRLRRKHPEDFGEELADLLESALAGDTRPVLQARVDRLLEDL
jgi:hypothetical protein